MHPPVSVSGVVRFVILHHRFTNRSMYYDDSVYNMNEPGSREALKVIGSCVILEEVCQMTTWPGYY